MLTAVMNLPSPAMPLEPSGMAAGMPADAFLTLLQSMATDPSPADPSSDSNVDPLLELPEATAVGLIVTPGWIMPVAPARMPEPGVLALPTEASSSGSTGQPTELPVARVEVFALPDGRTIAPAEVPDKLPAVSVPAGDSDSTASQEIAAPDGPPSPPLLPSSATSKPQPNAIAPVERPARGHDIAPADGVVPTSEPAPVARLTRYISHPVPTEERRERVERVYEPGSTAAAPSPPVTQDHAPDAAIQRVELSREVTWDAAVEQMVVESGPELQATNRAEFRFRVIRPDLGAVSVRLRADARGEVTAEMKVSSAAALQLMEDRLPELRDRLTAAGVSLSEFTIAQDGGSWRDSRRPLNWEMESVSTPWPSDPRSATGTTRRPVGQLDVTA